jgi:signal peptidase I
VEGGVPDMDRLAKQNRNALDWYESIVFAILLVAVIFTFAVRIVRVDGHSMDNTLADGERLLISSTPYTPERGQVVVVDRYAAYGKPLVKRVIAVGGDTVDINFGTGVVSVNGTPLEEPYTAEPTYLQESVTFPLTVPDGCLFLMGDNRNHSMDSRAEEIGCIDQRDILGRALARLMPLNKFGVIE